MGHGSKNAMTVTSPSVETTSTGPGRSLFGISFKKGGKVPGKGSKDSVKAKLTPGEVVVPKGRAKKDLKPKAFQALKPKKAPSGFTGY
jgi:hypothetical protein